MHDQRGPAFTPETLEAYFRAGVPTEHRLSDAPPATLQIEPDRRILRLRTPASDSPAEVGAYDRIRFDIIEEPGTPGIWFELTVEAEGMEYEAYSLLVSVVDGLAAGRPFRSSVDEALAHLRELLARRSRLSDEQELGLYGELCVLLHLVRAIGEEAATAAWLGPEGGEHDFILPDADVEVKTTRSEARIHTINNATQLTPAPGRPLYLLSIQLTQAGAALQGKTLPQCIAKVRGALQRSTRVFDDRLRAIGWRDTDSLTLYTRRFLPRSAPRSYRVDADFPAITSDGLAAIIRRPELVVGIAYRIDVSGIQPSTPPAALAGLQEAQTADGA